MEAASALAAPRAVVRVAVRARLGVVVFLAGGGTLATEICASRLLAPYFGSSTVVWANVIGLILLYLSVGYWVGGRVADSRPRPELLGRIILVAALAIAAIPFVSRPALDLALHGFAAVSVGVVAGSFLAALAMFALPVTLLGAVSPFAIRLALGDVSEAGSVAGRLYALSTVGSILGTFLSALVFVPLVGTRRTMVGTAALLALAAVLLVGRRWLAVARAYGRFYPRTWIDGVEIDPAVTEAGRHYLGLGDNPRLRTITADGRPFLALTRRHYDLIIVDAYHQPYVPFYLATREFFRFVHDHLRPSGMVALNVAAVPGDRRLTRAIGSTLASVFPSVWVWPALRFNDLLLATSASSSRAELVRRSRAAPPRLRSLVPLLRRELRPVAETEASLTDDRAPVEWLTDRMLATQIARGGTLDDRALPTAPR